MNSMFSCSVESLHQPGLTLPGPQAISCLVFLPVHKLSSIPIPLGAEWHKSQSGIQEELCYGMLHAQLDSHWHTVQGLGGELLMWLAVTSRSSPTTHNHRHLLKCNSLCNIHHLSHDPSVRNIMLLPFHYNDLHRNSVLAWAGLWNTDIDLLCKSTSSKPERHSCFCFWIVHLWDAWTGSQRGWRVCLEICYHVSQSTDSQMGNTINDNSHQDTNSSSPEHGYSGCAVPKGWLLPLLFKNDFHPFKFKIVWLISHDAALSHDETASARLLLRKPSALSWLSIICIFWNFAPYHCKTDKSQ